LLAIFCYRSTDCPLCIVSTQVAYLKHVELAKT
jgi:hypothetical protein